MRLFFLLGLGLVFVLVHVLCHSGVAVAAATAAAAAPSSPAALMKKLDARTAALMEKMDENQALQFQQIRLAFTSLRAVNDVHETLTRAKESCSANHPDIAADFATGLSEWEGTVMDSLARAQARLDDMVGMQSFTSPDSLRAYLKLLGRVMTAKQKAVPEVPISEIGACVALINRMESSSKVIGKSLADTLNLDTPLKVAP